MSLRVSSALGLGLAARLHGDGMHMAAAQRILLGRSRGRIALLDKASAKGDTASAGWGVDDVYELDLADKTDRHSLCNRPCFCGP